MKRTILIKLKETASVVLEQAEKMKLSLKKSLAAQVAAQKVLINNAFKGTGSEY